VSSAISVTLDNKNCYFSQTLISRITRIQVRASGMGRDVEGAFVYDNAIRTALFTPTAFLAPNQEYKVTIECDRTGLSSVFTDHCFFFITEAAPSVNLVISHPPSSRSYFAEDVYVAGPGSYRRLLRAICEHFEYDEIAVSSICVSLANGSLFPIKDSDDANTLRDGDVVTLTMVGDVSPTVGAAAPQTMPAPVRFSVLEIEQSALAVGELLHRGMFSSVYRARWRGSDVAVKVLRTDSSTRTRDALASELEVLSMLHHPRILTLMAICRDLQSFEGAVGLVMELMVGGSLYQVLHGGASHPQRPTTDSRRLKLALDIADGMRFLHHSRVVHRDLKSGNVLLDSDGRAKIADFGLSSVRTSSESLVTGVVGTVAWTAPEVLREEAEVRMSSDVYSFGVVLWEIFTGNVPWQGFSVIQIMSFVGVQNRRLVIPNNLVDSVKALVENCFGAADAREDFGAIYSTLHDQMLVALRRENAIAQEVPDCFLCPIGMEMMTDPVICSDGHSYERQHIQDWLQTSNRSPKTNLDLPNRTLIPNVALRAAIAAFSSS